jgi:hypothetical protein
MRSGRIESTGGCDFIGLSALGSRARGLSGVRSFLPKLRTLSPLTFWQAPAIGGRFINGRPNVSQERMRACPCRWRCDYRSITDAIRQFQAEHSWAF